MFPTHIKNCIRLLIVGGTLLFLSLLTSCSNTAARSTQTSGGKLYDPGYGPFDKDGNYIEALADAPAKQNRKPNIASNSSPAPVKAPKKSYWEKRKEKKEAEKIAKEKAQLAKKERERQEKEARALAKNKAKTAPVAAPAYTPTSAQPQRPAQPTYTPKPAAPTPVAQVKPKPVVRPQPKPVAKAKPKPVIKPQPKPVAKAKPKPQTSAKKVVKKRIHKIAKGDTLYNISRRYKTTVTAIQKANNMTGTTIILGQNLKIP